MLLFNVLLQTKVVASRRDLSAETVLQSLATTTEKRRRSMLPHSVVHCRAIQAEIQPQSVVSRWRQMVEATQRALPSKSFLHNVWICNYILPQCSNTNDKESLNTQIIGHTYIIWLLWESHTLLNRCALQQTHIKRSCINSLHKIKMIFLHE